MTRRICAGLLLLPLFFLSAAAALAQPLQKTHSIEGVTEYRLQNGLRVLTLPDPGIDTITVHIMYMVGSRHEGYGEKGMAHLLEHLLFKGSPRHPDIKDELTRRGARWNGTTSNDRTNYFETFSASDDNLDWALSLEADRMVNSRVTREDLDSEMTVVRNEFESGENSPGAVLFQRMQQLAFPWHNYGNADHRHALRHRVGADRPPAGLLPHLVPARQRAADRRRPLRREARARAGGEALRRHPAAERAACPRSTPREPTQDGERNVTLRRAGDNQMVMALYRVPAGSHPDYPALDVLVQTLGDAPSGRLHRTLVQKGLSSSAWASERGAARPRLPVLRRHARQAAPLDAGARGAARGGRGLGEGRGCRPPRSSARARGC